MLSKKKRKEESAKRRERGDVPGWGPREEKEIVERGISWQANQIKTGGRLTTRPNVAGKKKRMTREIPRTKENGR